MATLADKYKEYNKSWTGVMILGTVANGMSRFVSDLLWNIVKWPHTGWFGPDVIENYFLINQVAFEIAATQALTAIAVAKIPNIKKYVFGGVDGVDGPAA